MSSEVAKVRERLASLEANGCPKCGTAMATTTKAGDGLFAAFHRIRLFRCDNCGHTAETKTAVNAR